MSAAGFCSSVVDKRSGSEVTDLEPVLQALNSNQSLGKSEHFACPLLLDYEFTFNEKFHIAKAKLENDKNPRGVPYRECLEIAAREDDEECSKLTVKQARTFYDKVFAFYSGCIEFENFYTVLGKNLRNEIALLNESKKVSFDFSWTDEMVFALLTNPAGAKRKLVNYQNELITRISSCLWYNRKEMKRSSLESLDPLKAKPELVQSLMMIDCYMGIDPTDQILDTLTQNGLIDLCIREKDELCFEPTMLSQEDIESLSNNLFFLREILKHVLYIMDHATSEEIEDIRRFSIWSDKDRLDVPIIKNILLKDENSRSTFFQLHQDGRICDIKRYLQQGKLVTLGKFKFLTDEAVARIYAADMELPRDSHLSEQKIRTILENLCIID